MSWDATEDPADSGDLAVREPPKILIPVRVLEGQTVPEPLVEFLAPAEIVVLGYHVLPEQTPTEQGSMQFEDRAQEAVDAIAEAFRDAGRDIETRIVFTHDRDQTVERVAEEVGATATLLPNPSGEVEDVLVAVRGKIDVARLVDLVAALLVDGDERVTLWGVKGGGYDAESAVQRADATLEQRGFDPDRIAVETGDSETPIYDIVARTAEFDVVVMGEGGPPVLSAVFGDDAERVAEGAVAPVLVVRDLPEPAESEDEADATDGDADDRDEQQDEGAGAGT
ncbi:universal stress protein [Haloarchaeobius iranensis]|uniref:Nucleotide-binding universal stress protein, UspA family n=1 Tax=Haloarchaeobius iranensis TaxID=996166 RepID=A0A1G9YMA7_9EURY|nr:universal stress protein [Haloarchaeobius iranensis]SDN09613.1 Nucleotide-binding universal stress protein, UspA family [Haloarchaeobius iranensis]